jgi:type II restriction enzyme
LVKPKNLRSRSWIVSVMRCIEKIRRPEFTIDEMYQFEDDLRKAYPGNQHIMPKIRQPTAIASGPRLPGIHGAGHISPDCRNHPLN